jgi:hypothetical protein
MLRVCNKAVPSSALLSHIPHRLLHPRLYFRAPDIRRVSIDALDRRPDGWIRLLALHALEAMEVADGWCLAINNGPHHAVVLCSVRGGEAEAADDAAGARAGADVAGAGFVCLKGVDGAVHGAALAQHVPDDGQVRAEDATEWLEDGVGAQRDVVPCKVGAAAAEDDREANGGYNACSVRACVSSAM